MTKAHPNPAGVSRTTRPSTLKLWVTVVGTIGTVLVTLAGVLATPAGTGCAMPAPAPGRTISAGDAAL